MPTNLIVTVTPVAAASGSRGRPTKLFRGVLRTQIRKTLAKMIAIENADWRENIRSATLGYTPKFVTGPTGSYTEQCFTRVKNRLKECLAVKVGDE